MEVFILSQCKSSQQTITKLSLVALNFRISNQIISCKDTRARCNLAIRNKFEISNKILDEFVAVLKDWKVIFDLNPMALGYIRD